MKERADKTIENLCKLRQAIKAVDTAHVTNNHDDYGMSSHERLHCKEVLTVYIKRMEKIIEAVVPKPIPPRGVDDGES